MSKTIEYETPEWKKWSTVYCDNCSKPLAHYKGWHKPYLIATELYCTKCSNEIQKKAEQQTQTQESQP